LKFTHLVTNGCSWTYCQGLDDPKAQGWPTLLANKLGCPVVNLALPGSSNDGIVRRTFDYVYENKPFKNRPLFLIMYSQIYRREAWFNRLYDRNTNDYMTIPYPNPGLEEFKFHWKNSETLQEKIYFQEFDDEDFLRNDIKNKLSVKNLLENNHYDFFFAEYFKFDIPQATVEDVKKRFPMAYEEYSNLYDVRDVHNFTHGMKLPCGHDNLEGQEVVANLFYDRLVKKFGSLEVLPNWPFLELKNFQHFGPKNDNHWKVGPVWR